MIIPFEKIMGLCREKGIGVKRLLHVGSHEAEEQSTYNEYGISAFHVEPNPDLFPIVKSKVGEANCSDLAVSDKMGQWADFHRIYSRDLSNKGCSSLLKPTNILDNQYLKFVDTVRVLTTTIDNLNLHVGPFDSLAIDVQGAEMLAFKGATKLLSMDYFRLIIAEFTTKSMYEGDCLLDELDEFLIKFGFSRVITEYAGSGLCWGDSVYTKQPIKNIPIRRLLQIDF
jgi:FkbM family methyltransferase